MKTITEMRPLLVGEILRRAEARDARRAWWRDLWDRLRGLRAPRTHVARFSPTETIYSPGR